MEKGLQVRVSGEVCPVCGEPIRYGLVPIGDAAREFRLNCKCEDEKLKKERGERIAEGEASIRAAMRRTSGVPQRYRTARLERFVPVKGQETAYKAACAFVKRFCENRHTDGVYFMGGVGSGKTYLAAAVAEAVMAGYPVPEREAERAAVGKPAGSALVRFISTVELFERLKDGYIKGSGDALLEELKSAPLLILDDLGAEKTTDWTRERLFEIIDYRYSRELPLILTTNLRTEDLKRDLGERICDRIRETCVFAPVTAVSQRRTLEEGP